MEKMVILGDEYDDELKFCLINKLKEMGAKSIAFDWDIVGSQELESFSIILRDQIVKIESETFVGLSIFGPEEIVDEIASMVVM